MPTLPARGEPRRIVPPATFQDMTILGPQDILLLTWARDQAKSWRGAQDPADHAEFDKTIQALNETLEKVKRNNKVLRSMRKAAWP